MSIFEKMFSGRADSAQLTATADDEWHNYLTQDERIVYDKNLSKAGMVLNVVIPLQCLAGAALLFTPAAPVGAATIATGLSLSISRISAHTKRHNIKETALKRASKATPPSFTS